MTITGLEDASELNCGLGFKVVTSVIAIEQSGLTVPEALSVNGLAIIRRDQADSESEDQKWFYEFLQWSFDKSQENDLDKGEPVFGPLAAIMRRIPATIDADEWYFDENK